MSVKWALLWIDDNGGDPVSYQLSHTQILHHFLWHAELLLNQCTASGAEKHIQFTTLISLTQSISQPVSHPARHPVIQAAGLPFLEHFRWVFGCERALAMRFEEDYQGPESCLGASCAFQQSCRCPCCISVGKMWCVSLSLPLSVSVSLSLSLSLSLSFAKWFRHWKTWLQGLAVISRSTLLVSFFDDVQPFVVCVATTSSHLHLSSLCLWPSCACLSWGLPLCVSALNSGEVAAYCWPRTGHLA